MDTQVWITVPGRLTVTARSIGNWGRIALELTELGDGQVGISKSVESSLPLPETTNVEPIVIEDWFGPGLPRFEQAYEYRWRLSTISLRARTNKKPFVAEATKGFKNPAIPTFTLVCTIIGP